MAGEQCVLQAVEQQATVGKPGQGVEVGEIANLLLVLLARGNVLGSEGDPFVEIGRVDRRRGQDDVEQGAIFVSPAGFYGADALFADLVVFLETDKLEFCV